MTGLAFQLDGDNDYIDTDQLFGQPAALTITAWVKLAPGSPVGTIIGNHRSGATWESVELSDGSFTINTSNSSATRQNVTFPRVNDGLWHHLAAVWNGVDLRVYLDGSLHGGPVLASGAPWAASGKMWFGARQSASTPPVDNECTGLIDEIQVWNVARSQALIAAQKYLILGPEYTASADSGLIGYWRFEQTFDLGYGAPGVNDVKDTSIRGGIGDASGGVFVATNAVGVVGPWPGRPAIVASPNPFRASTEIAVAVAAGFTDVTVHDLRGRLVTRLTFAPGAARATWDGADASGHRVTPGVYLVRATTSSGRIVTGRIVRI